MNIDLDWLKKKLSEYLIKNLDSSKTNIDLLDILTRFLIVAKEEAITEAFPKIRKLDEELYEDPNSIFKQTLPIVKKGELKRIGKITFQDLYQRSPLSEEEKEKLKYSCVGFAGFGGAQYVSLILARTGIGNLIIADPDTFESSNANRQAFCYEDTLGRPKVEIGKEHLLKINSQISIETYHTEINEKNVDDIFDKTDLIIDAAGDWPTRSILHNYRKRENKPLMSIASAGWEGQYLTFMPEDPTYFDIFYFSRYTPERGFYLPAISILSSILANDAIKLLTGRLENVIRYPYVLTVNTQRLLPAEIRDLRYIKQRHDAYDKK